MRSGRERQGLGDPAAGGVEHAAQGPHRPGRLGGGGEEGGALVGGQIEALALGVVQLHGGDRRHAIGNSGKRKPRPPGR